MAVVSQVTQHGDAAQKTAAAGLEQQKDSYLIEGMQEYALSLLQATRLQTLNQSKSGADSLLGRDATGRVVCIDEDLGKSAVFPISTLADFLRLTGLCLSYRPTLAKTNDRMSAGGIWMDFDEIQTGSTASAGQESEEDIV